MKTGTRLLTPAKVVKLRERFAKPDTYGKREDRIHAAASSHGVSPSTIRNAIAGRTYKQAGGPITTGRNVVLAQAA